MGFFRTFEGAVLLVLRLGLGGLFLWAAYVKFDDPQAFADSIKGFHLLDESGDHLVMLATFVVPWIEALAGALLVLGLWTRGSAAVLLLNLAVFSGAISSVLARGISTKCGCFGEFSPFCPDEISTCNLVQNGVLGGIALLLLLRGGGSLALDGQPVRTPRIIGKASVVRSGDDAAIQAPGVPRPTPSIKQVAAFRPGSGAPGSGTQKPGSPPPRPPSPERPPSAR